MDSTKLASYVAGCDDSHNDPSPSHERDDAGERHQRLVLVGENDYFLCLKLV